MVVEEGCCSPQRSVVPHVPSVCPSQRQAVPEEPCARSPAAPLCHGSNRTQGSPTEPSVAVLAWRGTVEPERGSAPKPNCQRCHPLGRHRTCWGGTSLLKSLQQNKGNETSFWVSKPKARFQICSSSGENAANSCSWRRGGSLQPLAAFPSPQPGPHRGWGELHSNDPPSLTSVHQRGSSRGRDHPALVSSKLVTYRVCTGKRDPSSI